MVPFAVTRRSTSCTGIRENGFMNRDGDVVLTKVNAPPTVDEKLGEEEGTVREKNDALTQCRKYIGQMMWLTTRTRPDIAACLGILASLMVRRPKEVKNHLVCLWRYLWTKKDHAMCTLPSPDAARKIVLDNRSEVEPSSARDGPMSCSSPLVVQTYCDASFAKRPIGHQPCFGSQEDKVALSEALTCIRTVSRKYPSTSLYLILGMWWSYTKHSRNHLLLRIVERLECVWVMTPALLVVLLSYLWLTVR